MTVRPSRRTVIGGAGLLSAAAAVPAVAKPAAAPLLSDVVTVP